ncbi:hypothetical protein IRJ41_022460 [Triplophysa rosa]|uniref:Uncharacterized protein n=1 Tax=Triplophysa rosa TaxID=992332 RepID=A0A9W7X129_TRIRA|nr:hypothetical protein IRJ41_022460 [Triplophysa rosa]
MPKITCKLNIKRNFYKDCNGCSIFPLCIGEDGARIYVNEHIERHLNNLRLKCRNLGRVDTKEADSADPTRFLSGKKAPSNFITQRSVCGTQRRIHAVQTAPVMRSHAGTETKTQCRFTLSSVLVFPTAHGH